MGREYEITGYIMIPISVTQMGESVEDALEKGVQRLESGEGEQGEQFTGLSFSAWDIEGHMAYPKAVMEHGEITIHDTDERESN